MSRLVIALAILCSLVGSDAARAQVSVERSGSENPMKEIATSVIYGGLAGLVMGGATALAVEENEDDIVKWFFVGGTFFGFGYGIYHVANRPQPHSLVALDENRRPRLGVPLPRLSFARGGDSALSVTLLSFAF